MSIFSTIQNTNQSTTPFNTYPPFSISSNISLNHPNFNSSLTSNIINNINNDNSLSINNNNNNSSSCYFRNISHNHSNKHFKSLSSPSSILRSKLKSKLLNGQLAAPKRAHPLPHHSGSCCSLSSSYLNQNSKALQIFQLNDNNTLINTNHNLAASHQANRYRQSASPARQRLGPGGGSMISSSGKLGSTGSQLSVFGRGSKRSNMLPPYRTQQTSAHKALPIGGSMQNVSPLAFKPPRRSSAVGICNDGANSTAAASNFRSHSVDGLLDSSESSEQKIAEAAALVSAGSLALTNASSTSTLQPNEDFNGSLNDLHNNEVSVSRREKSAHLPPINPQHRKSRSLDHFLDEQTLASIVVPPSPTDGTQSMQNLATLLTPEPVRCSMAMNGNSTMPMRSSSVRDSKSLTPDRVTVLRQSPSNRQSPEGVSSAEDEHEDAQSQKSSSQSTKSGQTSPIATKPPTASAPKSQTRAAAHVHRGNTMSSQRGETASRVPKTTSSSSLGSAPATAATTVAAAGANSNPNNKTLLNRTFKKVRSLIKK